MKQGDTLPLVVSFPRWKWVGWLRKHASWLSLPWCCWTVMEREVSVAEFETTTGPDGEAGFTATLTPVPVILTPPGKAPISGPGAWVDGDAE